MDWGEGMGAWGICAEGREVIEKWNDLQLEFDLDLDDVNVDAEERAISYAEARRISEAAFYALKETMRTRECEWFGDYLSLIEKGWPWRVACYIAWASSPKTGRWPETLQKLAVDVLGLTGTRTIYTWRKKYPTIDSVVAMLQSAPLWEHRREVFDALVEVASSRDYKGHQDRELFFTLTGDLVKRSELQIGRAAKDALEEMSDEELRAWLGESMKDEEKGEEDVGDGDED